MNEIQLIILYSLLSGSTVFLGGLLSHYFGEHVKNGLVKSEIIHSTTAFGGGILIAAVGLVLVPKGMQMLSLAPMVLFFAIGAIAFFYLDQFIEKKGGTEAQLLGMLSDFIPESIAMGAVFSQDPELGILLMVIIALQNFPEAFNAYLDLKSNYSSRKSLWILFLLSFSGILAALLGYYFLSEMPMVIGALMLFSAGGVTYLIFQDIAPMSKLDKSWIPALGASLGFLVGMIGVKILG
ncbi:ZIP family metal transporter [Gillisia sp. CAL575]|uniref:ZIP family metal transporter n=1 Tax=Gillisia sp. CAL575 TaxID=985255 RepID=UPI000550D1FD|nr:divalent cation transporter [Gillisia sp. CAL575]